MCVVCNVPSLEIFIFRLKPAGARSSTLFTIPSGAKVRGFVNLLFKLFAARPMTGRIEPVSLQFFKYFTSVHILAAWGINSIENENRN